MRLAFFEDLAATGFAPIAWMRPVCELLCGQFSLRERLLRSLSVSDWGAFIRPFLAETYQEAQPEAHLNDFTWLASEPTLLINSRWLPDAAAVRRLEHAGLDEAGVIDQTLVWLRLHPDEVALLSNDRLEEGLIAIARTRTLLNTTGRMATRLVFDGGTLLPQQSGLKPNDSLPSANFFDPHGNQPKPDNL